MDTQSVKTSTNVPTETQGIDAGKKIVGRKRGIITDSMITIAMIDNLARRLTDEIALSWQDPQTT